MSSDKEVIERIDISDITSNVKPVGNETDLDNELYYRYVILAKKQFKDVDLHFIEFAIAEHLLYDVKGIERPKENTEEYELSKAKIEELIKQTREITEEMMTSEDEKKQQKEEITEVTEERTENEKEQIEE
jgi:hypothetical protein